MDLLNVAGGNYFVNHSHNRRRRFAGEICSRHSVFGLIRNDLSKKRKDSFFFFFFSYPDEIIFNDS